MTGPAASSVVVVADEVVIGALVAGAMVVDRAATVEAGVTTSPMVVGAA
jgi:hypothetical protein